MVEAFPFVGNRLRLSHRSLFLPLITESRRGSGGRKFSSFT